MGAQGVLGDVSVRALGRPPPIVGTLQHLQATIRCPRWVQTTPRGTPTVIGKMAEGL